MRRALFLLLGLLVAVPLAAAAGTGRDFEGSWMPPPIAASYYRVTTTLEDSTYTGRLTDGTTAGCTGGPRQGEVFWTAEQDGSAGGEPTFGGRTFAFLHSADNETCEARMVRARFWSPRDDYLRVCPSPFEDPEAEPPFDFESDIDESTNSCEDFRRTDDPLEPQPHKAKDYIPKITRDEKTCKTDYNVYLRYVEDDPMNRVRVFVKRKTGGFKRIPNNELFLPLKTDADRTRILDFRWVKKGPLTVRARIRTQSGAKHKRTRHFTACT